MANAMDGFLGTVGGSSQITNNVLKGNGTDGLAVFGAPTRLVVSGNKVVSNGARGLSIATGDGQPVVTGNVTNGNGTDGLFVADPTASLGKNVGSFNSAFGIDAFDPAINDLGGNTAEGNGNSHQCKNVVCT